MGRFDTDKKPAFTPRGRTTGLARSHAGIRPSYSTEAPDSSVLYPSPAPSRQGILRSGQRGGAERSYRQMSPAGVGASGVRMQSSSPAPFEALNERTIGEGLRRSVGPTVEPMFVSNSTAQPVTNALSNPIGRPINMAAGGQVDDVKANLMEGEFVIDTGHSDQIRRAEGAELKQALMALAGDIKSGRRPGDRPVGGRTDFTYGGNVTEDMRSQPVRGYQEGGPVDLPFEKNPQEFKKTKYIPKTHPGAGPYTEEEQRWMNMRLDQQWNEPPTSVVPGSPESLYELPPDKVGGKVWSMIFGPKGRFEHWKYKDLSPGGQRSKERFILDEMAEQRNYKNTGKWHRYQQDGTFDPMRNRGAGPQEWEQPGYRMGGSVKNNQPGYALGGRIEEDNRFQGLQQAPQQMQPARASLSAPPSTPLTVRRQEGIQAAEPTRPRLSPSVGTTVSPSPLQGVTRAAPPASTVDTRQITPQTFAPAAPLSPDDSLRDPVQKFGVFGSQTKNLLAQQQRWAEEQRQAGVDSRGEQGWSAIAALYGYEGQGADLQQWAQENGYTILNDGTIVDPNAPPGYQQKRNIKTDGSFASWLDNKRKAEVDAETEAGEKTAREAIDQKRQAKLQQAEDYITKASTEGAELKRRVAQFTARQKAAVSGLAMSQAMAARGTQSMQAGLGSMANAQHQAILQGAAEQFAGEMEAERLMLSAELKKMEVELQILDEEINDEQDDKRRAQMIADQNRMAEAAAANAKHQQMLQAQIAEASKPEWWESLLPALITGGMGLLGNMIVPGVGGVLGGALGSAFSTQLATGQNMSPRFGNAAKYGYGGHYDAYGSQGAGVPPSPSSGTSPSPSPSANYNLSPQYTSS